MAWLPAIALANRKAAKKTQAPDWVFDQVTRPVSKENAYAAVVLLQSATPLRPNKVQGAAILPVALDAVGWAEPVQVGGAYLWGQSQAFKANTAVELAEAAQSYATKRAFALTLASRRDDRKMRTWAGAVRRSHADLDATAAWLEAA